MSEIAYTAKLKEIADNVVYILYKPIKRRDYMNNISSSQFEELKRKRELKIANSSIKKKVKNVTQEIVVDKITGEILSENVTSQNFIDKGSEPPFIKLYIDDLILLNDLPTKSSAILWELLKTLGASRIFRTHLLRMA